MCHSHSLTKCGGSKRILAEWILPSIYKRSDKIFTRLQKSFISKQIAAYGNITRFCTLDQYNENNPYSGDLGYLRNVTHNTWKSLKAANPAAVWVMHGWPFFSNSDFWTDARVKASLSGIEENKGQEGNEIMNNLLLNQVWDTSPINTVAYFRKWVRARYMSRSTIPESLYSA